MQPQVIEHGLQQFDSDPAVLRIEHHPQNAFAPQATGECFHAEQRIGEVMQHAGRDDQIEIASQRRQLFDRKQMQLQICQPVFFFEISLMVQ